MIHTRMLEHRDIWAIAGQVLVKKIKQNAKLDSSLRMWLDIQMLKAELRGHFRKGSKCTFQTNTRTSQCHSRKYGCHEFNRCTKITFVFTATFSTHANKARGWDKHTESFSTLAKQDRANRWQIWVQGARGCVIVTLVSAAVADAAAGGASSGETEAWLSVGEGVGVVSGESTAQICSSSRTAVDDE